MIHTLQLLGALMIHALQLLGALILTMVSVWVLQLFIYSLGGYLFVVCWISLILYAFIKSTTNR